MAEFTPINTQEELDGIIASRLKRERETIGKQYQTQLEERDSKIAGFETQVTDLNKQIESLSAQAGKVPEMEARIREYETSSVKMRIARETGLPAELADRLTGGDEAAMRADAEGLAKLLSQNQPVAPMYHPGSEGGNGSAKEQAMKNLLDNIRPN